MLRSCPVNVNVTVPESVGVMLIVCFRAKAPLLTETQSCDRRDARSAAPGPAGSLNVTETGKYRWSATCRAS